MIFLKNVWSLICISICVIYLPPMYCIFAQNIGISLNGKPLQYTTPAVLENGHTYIPVDGYFEALGIQTVVDAPSKTITGKKNNTTFTMTLDQTQALTNGNPVALDCPPKVINGVIMAPLRFVAENAGAVVGWHPEISTVSLNLPQSEIPQLTRSVVTIKTDHTQGSGIIISSDGLIATNFHVISNASNAVIIFSDGEMYNGLINIAGYDVSSDIAILKINQNHLTPVEFGRSSNELGMDIPVTAIGSPQGQMNTVSHGVITSIHNQIICTTAAIDVGSSGGALFDQNGKLLGMTSGFSNDTYFAIPAEKIKAVSKNMHIPLANANKIPIPLVPPKDITWTTINDEIFVSWEPIAGVDYFNVYLSPYPDKDFSKITNPMTHNNQWYWDNPYCFGISTTHRGNLYLCVSTTKDDIESPLSAPIKIK